MQYENNLDFNTVYTLKDPARLDLFLVEQMQGHARSRIQKHIKHGHVSVNGITITKSGFLLYMEDVIKVRIPQKSATDTATTAFDVCYEDEHLLIINKPAGFVVFPARDDEIPIAVSSSIHFETLDRGGILHRLDKETSGLLMIAKTQAGAAYYASLFHDRHLTKEYLAIIEETFPYMHSTIDSPIGRHSTDRKKMSISHKGKAAISEVFQLQSENNFSLLRIILHTGRTHQIRVHLSSIGHPIAGDPLYGKRGEYPRTLLHAAKLQFVPYQANNSIEVYAPIPEDMLHVLSQMNVSTNDTKSILQTGKTTDL